VLLTARPPRWRCQRWTLSAGYHSDQRSLRRAADSVRRASWTRSLLHLRQDGYLPCCTSGRTPICNLAGKPIALQAGHHFHFSELRGPIARLLGTPIPPWQDPPISTLNLPKFLDKETKTVRYQGSSLLSGNSVRSCVDLTFLSTATKVCMTCEI